MQTLAPSDVKKGTVLMLDGVPHRVEDFHVSGAAKTKPKLHARIRNLQTGRFADRVFADNETLKVADLEYRKVQLSYIQGDEYVFLDTGSFEDVVLTEPQLGDRRWFIRENDEMRASFLEGKLLDIELPAQKTLAVSETAPPVKGGSDSTWKPATLETGLEVMVPLFIEKGEYVRIDTQQKKYVGRES